MSSSSRRVGSTTFGTRARSSRWASRTSSHASGAALGSVTCSRVTDSSCCTSSRTTRACSTSRAAATAASNVRSPSVIGSRSAPYSTPRTLRRTTTGTATTERSPSAATAMSYSWLIWREEW